MINLTDYTSYAEVRAVIGVDALELPDETIALPVYSAMLYRALRGIVNENNETLLYLYESIEPSGMTDAQSDLYYATRELATYVVAEGCCSGLSMFALKSDSDGKASQSRFSSEATFKDVLMNLRVMIASLSAKLDELLYGTSSTVVFGLTAIQPDVDKVTGE